MKLQVGRTYVDRDGDKVKIVAKTGSVKLPFSSDCGDEFAPDGLYWSDGTESGYDLISMLSSGYYRIHKIWTEGARYRKYYFNLHAANGKVICTSQMYKSKRGCLKGIESIRNNADADIREN